MHYELINSMPQLICILDAHGFIVYVNKAWTKAAIERGISREHRWEGTNYLTISVLNHYSERPNANEIMHMIQEVLDGKRQSLTLEYPCHSAQERRWFKMSVTPFNFDNRAFFIVSHEDISSIKLELEEAQLLCLQDPLTEIANRRHFNQYLHQMFARSIQHANELTLMLIDIDQFKRINDIYGQNIGDEVLIAIAGILNQHCQTQPALASRLVGDVFALVCEVPLRQAIDLALQLLHQVRQLNQVYECHGEVKITVSIGIASCIPGQFSEKEQLYTQADQYLKKAKQGGKNRIEAGMLSNTLH